MLNITNTTAIIKEMNTQSNYFFTLNGIENVIIFCTIISIIAFMTEYESIEEEFRNKRISDIERNRQIILIGFQILFSPLLGSIVTLIIYLLYFFFFYFFITIAAIVFILFLLSFVFHFLLFIFPKAIYEFYCKKIDKKDNTEQKKQEQEINMIDMIELNETKETDKLLDNI